MNPYDEPKPGFRWPVAVTRPIAASAEQVWEAISAPGNLEPCHPFCKTNTTERWPGEGSVDRLEYLNGWVEHSGIIQQLERLELPPLDQRAKGGDHPRGP